MVTHKGGCHCGRVRFEVDAPEVLELDECNCSICKMSYCIHHVVPKERFRLVSGEEHLTIYRFNTGIAAHPFCSVCGVKSFYYPRAYPQGISVNPNCLDHGTVKAMKVTRSFDAANWEERLNHYEPPSL